MASKLTLRGAVTIGLIVAFVCCIVAIFLRNQTRDCVARLGATPLAIDVTSTSTVVVLSTGQVVDIGINHEVTARPSGPPSLSSACFILGPVGQTVLFVGDVNGRVYMQRHDDANRFVQCGGEHDAAVWGLRGGSIGGGKIVVSESASALIETTVDCVPIDKFSRITRGTAAQGAALLRQYLLTITELSSIIDVDPRTGVAGTFQELFLGEMVGGAVCIRECSDGRSAVVGTTAGYLMSIGGDDAAVMWQTRIYDVSLTDVFFVADSRLLVTNSLHDEVAVSVPESNGVRVITRRKCDKRVTAVGAMTGVETRITMGFDDGTVEVWRLK